MHVVMKELVKPSHFVSQIDHMHQKLVLRGRLFEESENDVLFYHISLMRKQFATLLARSIKQETFFFGLGLESSLMIKNKPQTVIHHSITDRIVEGVLTRILSSHANSVFSDSLCSYRSGMSVNTAIQCAAQFITSHRTAQQKKQVNLYGLKTDIAGYCNTIPVHSTSPIWGKLRALLRSIDREHEVGDYLWRLIERVVVPHYLTEEGEVAVNDKGLSFGSSIACLIYNYYVCQMDFDVHAIPGLFYIRYCDDILLMHEDKDCVNQAYALIRDVLQKDQLDLSKEKTKLFYLTVPGKPCEDHNFIGCNSVSFLGTSIQATGNVRLLSHHTREFLKQVRHRIDVVCQQTRHLSFDERGFLLCRAVRHAIHPGSTFAVGKLTKLFDLHNERQQLRQLDWQIAQWVVQALTGTSGRAGFSQASYRQLRHQWGLPSLVNLRNKVREIAVK